MRRKDIACLMAGTVLMLGVAVFAAGPIFANEPRLTVEDLIDAALPPEETEETEILDKTAFWPYVSIDESSVAPVETVRASCKLTPVPQTSEEAPQNSYSDDSSEEDETLEAIEMPQETTLGEPDEQPPCMAGNDLRTIPQQIVMAATPEERDMLARIARAECGGESVQSMACIVAMVCNRVADPHFPGTICEVIEAPGQYKVVASGAYYQPASEASIQAVDMVAAGYDPSYGATYFSTGRSAWHWNSLQYLGTFEKIYLYHEWE